MVVSTVRRVRRTYVLLTGVDYFAEFLWGITGTLYFLDKGLSPSGIGMMLAVFWWAEAIFQIPTGVIADLWGRKPAIIGGYLTRAIGYLMVALLPNLTVGVIGFLIVGLGSTMTGGAAEAWGIDELTAVGGSPTELDRFFAVSKASENTGMVAGSLVGALAGSVSLAAPFELTVVFFVIAAVIGTVMMQESRPRTLTAGAGLRQIGAEVKGVFRATGRAIRRDRTLGMLMSISTLPRVFGAAPGLQWNVYLSTYVAGTYVYLGIVRSAAYGCALLVAALMVPVLVRGVNRSTVVAVAGVLGGLSLAFAAVVPVLVAAIVGYVLYTGSRSAVEPSVMAAINSRIDQATRATMISSYSALAGFAYGIGYLLFGVLIKDLSVVRTSWLVTGLLTAIVTIPIARLVATSPRPAAVEQVAETA